MTYTAELKEPIQNFDYFYWKIFQNSIICIKELV